MRLWKQRSFQWDLEDAYWAHYMGNELKARLMMVKLVDAYFKEEERGKRKQEASLNK